MILRGGYEENGIGGFQRGHAESGIGGSQGGYTEVAFDSVSRDRGTCIVPRDRNNRSVSRDDHSVFRDRDNHSVSRELEQLGFVGFDLESRPLPLSLKERSTQHAAVLQLLLHHDTQGGYAEGGIVNSQGGCTEVYDCEIGVIAQSAKFAEQIWAEFESNISQLSDLGKCTALRKCTALDKCTALGK